MSDAGNPRTMYGAEWLVETWGPNGARLRVDYCESLACADAAYEAAVKASPHDRVTFRHRGSMIKERVGEWTP